MTAAAFCSCDSIGSTPQAGAFFGDNLAGCLVGSLGVVGIVVLAALDGVIGGALNFGGVIFAGAWGVSTGMDGCYPISVGIDDM